jgi:hypothetical protein
LAPQAADREDKEVVMTNANGAMPKGAVGRTVHGPVISNFMFFRVLGAEQAVASNPVVTACLRAQSCHEIWIASCDDQMSSFRGTLELHGAASGSAPEGGNCLVRTDTYNVDLRLDADAFSEFCAHRLRSNHGIDLVLEFDVEYMEGYESPGGYSEAFGIRYWDDIAFPRVPIHRYRFGKVATG